MNASEHCLSKNRNTDFTMFTYYSISRLLCVLANTNLD